MPNGSTLPHSAYSIKGRFSFGLRQGGRTVHVTRLHAHRGRVGWNPESADPVLDGLSGLYCDDAIHHQVWVTPRRGAHEPALADFARFHLLPLAEDFQQLAGAMTQTVLEHPSAAGRWPLLTVGWHFELNVSSGGASPRISRLLVRQTGAPGSVFLGVSNSMNRIYRVLPGPMTAGADGDTWRHYNVRDSLAWAAVRRDMETKYSPATLALVRRLTVGRAMP